MRHRREGPPVAFDRVLIPSRLTAHSWPEVPDQVRIECVHGSPASAMRCCELSTQHPHQRHQVVRIPLLDEGMAAELSWDRSGGWYADPTDLHFRLILLCRAAAASRGDRLAPARTPPHR